MIFATIYTDASFRIDQRKATIAFKSKCEYGSLQGSLEIDSHDVHHAEMSAIKLGIESTLSVYPEIIGVFVNCDNLNCVQRFWPFKNFMPNPLFDLIKDDIMKMLGTRWIRTKHVKAHTGKNDTRSYMNRTVDRMTRR